MLPSAARPLLTFSTHVERLDDAQARVIFSDNRGHTQRHIYDVDEAQLPDQSDFTESPYIRYLKAVHQQGIRAFASTLRSAEVEASEVMADHPVEAGPLEDLGDDLRLHHPDVMRVAKELGDADQEVAVEMHRGLGLSRGARGEAQERHVVAPFVDGVWPGRDVAPVLYVDPRTAGWNADPEHRRGGYFALMHAKVVIVDGEQCILGSANFTDAGTTRNIEAGVWVRSEEFARTLLGQWRGLIANGMLRRVGG